MAKFTKKQLDDAARILIETDLVKNWALGELRAFSVDLSSPKGQKFYAEKRLAIANRILSTAI